MKNFPLKRSEIATGLTVHVGIDVAMASMAVCVLGPGMEVLAREKLPHTEAAVRGLLGRLPGCTIHAAYEAGPTGYRLVQWLRAHGCAVAAIVAPSRIPVASGDRVKTDKRDALKIATLLATGQLADLAISDLTDEQYADRQLVRCRQQAVWKHTDICLQIKSLLLMHHVALPDGMASSWGRPMREWLATVKTGQASLDVALREQVSWLNAARGAVGRLNVACVELGKQPRHAASMKLLRSIPGVGPLTAITVLTELPDLVKRFRTAEALSRFLGLVPTEHSTGKTQGRRGHLTHDGNASVRSALVEASWRLVRQDAHVAARYEELKKRCGGRKAVVAIAHQLAVTIHAMLRTNTEYRRREVKLPLAA